VYQRPMVSANELEGQFCCVACALIKHATHHMNHALDISAGGRGVPSLHGGGGRQHKPVQRINE